jgi:hypothetical protein
MVSFDWSLAKISRGEPNAYELTIFINFRSIFPVYTINQHSDLGVNSYLIVDRVGIFTPDFLRFAFLPDYWICSQCCMQQSELLYCSLTYSPLKGGRRGVSLLWLVTYQLSGEFVTITVSAGIADGYPP